MSLNGPAAARLYDEHVDAIYTYAARRVGPEAAVTVVEEVFEQALRKNAERPPHTGSDLGWLFAMATAFLRRHSEAECRRLRAWEPVLRETSKAIPRVSDPLLTNDAEDPAVTLTTDVMAAIADLEPVERDVLFLVAWEGCSSALTATATGLPQNEVRPTLARIRKSIRLTVAANRRPPAADTAPVSPTPDAAVPEASTSTPDATSTPTTATPVVDVLEVPVAAIAPTANMIVRPLTPDAVAAAEPDLTEPVPAEPVHPDMTETLHLTPSATDPHETLDSDDPEPEPVDPEPEPVDPEPEPVDPDATEPLDRSDDPLDVFRFADWEDPS